MTENNNKSIAVKWEPVRGEIVCIDYDDFNYGLSYLCRIFHILIRFTYKWLAWRRSFVIAKSNSKLNRPSIK